jgi:hypothetical protein
MGGEEKNREELERETGQEEKLPLKNGPLSGSDNVMKYF